MSENLGDAVLELRADASGLERDMTAAHASAAQKMDAAGKSMQSTGRTMTLAVTAPVVGFGAAAFDAFGTFDKTMRQVGSIADLSGKDLKVMTDLALQMGKETSFSAGQAAEAMLELAKGGMSAAEIRASGLKDTLTLAAAGGIKLGDSAKYMANTISMFGLKASDSGKVAAALAGAANASTASVESLGMGLSQTGASAKLAGMGLDETVAALALLDENGVKGSDAGTSLKTMLTNLTPQTDKAAAAMKRLGLDFTDAQGNFLPMRDVAQQLQDKMRGLSQEQKVQALSTIFGSDAIRAATIMADGGAKGIDRLTAATHDMGAAQELAKTNTEGAKGGIEQMMGSIETAGILIGKQMAPHVISLAKKVADMANRFSELDPKTQRVILGILGLAAAIGPVLLVLGTVLTVLPAVAAAFAAITLPVIAVVAGLAVLGVALVKLYKDNEWFRKEVKEIWEKVSKSIKVLLGDIQKTMQTWVRWAKQLWEGHGTEITAYLKSMWTILKTLFGTQLASIRDGIRIVLALLRGDWQGAWDVMKQSAQRFWDAIKTLVPAAINAMKSAASLAMDGVKAMLSAAWDVIKGAASKIWEAIKDNALDKIRQIGNDAAQAARNIPGQLANALAATVQKAENIGGQILKAIVSAVSDIGLKFWDAAKNLPGLLWNATAALLTKADAIGDAINKKVIAGVKAVAGALAGAFGRADDALWAAATGAGSIIAKAVAIGDNIKDKVVDGVRAVAGALGRALGGADDALWNAAKAMIAKGTAIGKAIGDNIKDAINWVIGKIRSFQIPEVKIAGKTIPGTGGHPFSGIPMLARGGVVTDPTLAMIGEGRSDEAVVPLDEYTVSRKGAGAAGGGVHITQNFRGEPDPWVASRRAAFAFRTIGVVPAG